MIGKRYYITTVDAWQRHAARFSNSHWLALSPCSEPALGQGTGATPPAPASSATPADTRILVLIEGDEGAHLALEDDPGFEPLPHPLAQKPISNVAHAALQPLGVSRGATTFEVAETVARAHPLLRHRVF